MLSINARVQSTLRLSSLKTNVSSSEKQEWINERRVTKSRAGGGGSAHWKKPYSSYRLRTCPMLLHNNYCCIRSLHTCIQYWTIKMNQIPREERHKNSIRIANNLFHNPVFICFEIKLRCSFHKQIRKIKYLAKHIYMKCSRFLLHGKENRT